MNRSPAPRPRRLRLTPRGKAVAMFAWGVALVLLVMALSGLADALVSPEYVP